MSRTAFCHSGALPTASTVFEARSFLDPQASGELSPRLSDPSVATLPGYGC
ncbi:hypothetical protein H7A76_07885 [Pseudomonas sp. MSSRFD41]|uniref:hypothetical protein n=1 Tax=Pseudomonas sp. MSSRFD41 TaxID=1310370 RepID=UPI001639CFA8|nr:hypothetical protein [Pseudomonas sp. MSSRFD41]MBC2655356.1 hypothetical protein [Pseudomonas sp. MSSRFD41]